MKFSAWLCGAASVAAIMQGSSRAQPPSSPDVHAARTLQAMTLDEKLTLVHGIMAYPSPTLQLPDGALVGAGYVAGVPRLGVPALKETDASLGVHGGDGATALASGLSLAATFDPEIARETGALIGNEAWSWGYNVLLAGGVNLARDPRGGRNFEYLGEDPVLAGRMAGASIRGIQSQHVISTIKHFAMNDQENGRDSANAVIALKAARESDLLAFEIAIEDGRPGAVMCGYNLVNGRHDCGSGTLLNDILKKDWRYPGWVMSDWGAVYGLDYAIDGLDQQSGSQLDPKVFFDAPLREAASSDPRYRQRLDDMARRILRSIYAVGIEVHPPAKTPIDFESNARVAQRASERGIVLLKNERGLLPLARTARRIAVIGWHADAGVLSGGGSSQVVPKGGPTRTVAMGGDYGAASLRNMVLLPSSPLKAIGAKNKDGSVRFADGTSLTAAARLAARSDLVIVFATQWMMEGYDAPDIDLPFGQDQMIEAVAAANPNVVVVLETGGPVRMPWLDKVGAVLEAWYPGIHGADAVADILYGDSNPSGRLPVTFPKSVDQLPRPEIPGWDLINAEPWDWTHFPKGRPFDIDYDVEGADVGYRWFARKRETPLFPFGFGLSYSRFATANLTVVSGTTVTARFTVTNESDRKGRTTPQLYLTGRDGVPVRRLVGWASVELAPHETRTVTITAEPRALADWLDAGSGWTIKGGAYSLTLADNAADVGLSATVRLARRRLPSLTPASDMAGAGR